jgi:hypothetical protein
VRLADDLAAIHDELTDDELPAGEEAEDVRAFFSDTNRGVQRARKVAKILEDNLRVPLGHSKWVRIAGSAAQYSSVVSTIVAGYNVLRSADNLDGAHASADSIQDIAGKEFHEFYRALGVFVAECILYVTPINYKFAWRSTRYLNNRFLYTLRHSGFSGRVDSLLKGLHRLILSETHYAIRGIVPAALRTPEEFANYLASMGTQTIRILRQFSDVGIEDLPGLATQVVDEYWQFIENVYDIVIPDVNLQAIITDVVDQLSGDIFSIPEQ